MSQITLHEIAATDVHVYYRARGDRRALETSRETSREQSL